MPHDDSNIVRVHFPFSFTHLDISPVSNSFIFGDNEVILRPHVAPVVGELQQHATPYNATSIKRVNVDVPP
jgi:hypothetical protein